MSQSMNAVIVPGLDAPPPHMSAVAEMLDALEVTKCSLAFAMEGSEEWDKVREYNVVDRQKQLTSDEFVEFSRRNDGRYVHAEIDGVLQSLALLLRDRYPAAVENWQPCTGTFAVGLHSYPDIDYEETIWRGHVSVSIWGYGIADLDAMREALTHDAQWQDIMRRVSAVLRVPTRFELVADY